MQARLPDGWAIALRPTLEGATHDFVECRRESRRLRLGTSRGYDPLDSSARATRRALRAFRAPAGVALVSMNFSAWT